MKRFKIIGKLDDREITLDFAENETEAREKRIKFAKSFSSSWTITIEPFR